jgi:predicted alpha/beta-fold hydrolase
MKKLTFKETTENINIIKNMEPLDFIPAFFIPTYLTQAGFHEMKNIQTTFFKREYIINDEDNGLISLDWVTISNKTESHRDRVLVIMHGLSGGSDTLYIRDIADAFKYKYSVVVLHARGINDTPLITTQSNHAGFTKDIKYSLNYIRANYSFKYRFLLGVSMGANLTYQLLAKERCFDDYLTGYLSISNPFHQLIVMKNQTGCVTDFFLLMGKKEYMLKHKEILLAHPNFDFNKICNTNITRDFDNEYLAKLNGYESAEDYYNKTSSGPLIDKLINIKTLILVSKDDPIVFLFDDDYEKSKLVLFN